MSNFSRQTFPFTIGSDPSQTSGSVETVDFKVSTDGTTHINTGTFVVSTATINGPAVFKSTVGVSSVLSVTGAAQLNSTLAVSGASTMVGIVNATGGVSSNANSVLIGNLTLSVVNATCTVKAVSPWYWPIKSAGGTTLYIPVYTSLV
jgi:hypothetical protein